MSTRVRSFSKVNLGLAIGPVREDGFHGLATLYQTLALHDVVSLKALPLARGAASRLKLTTNHPRVPVDSRNTAWRMVCLALERMKVAAEVEVHIEKTLPVQGGMGAGSANAAAALLGLERELGGALPQADRMQMAAEVGSDVPLFLVGGAVLGSGRGEKVQGVTDLPATHCVVAMPSVGVSTPRAFREWDAAEAARLTSGDHSSTLEKLSRTYASLFSGPTDTSYRSENAEPGITGIVHGLSPDASQAGSVGDLAEDTLLALVRTGIENDFEDVVFSQYPSLRQIKRLLMGMDSDSPALYAALSGSGSALFGLYAARADAEAAQQRVQTHGVTAIATETLPRDEYWRRMFAE